MSKSRNERATTWVQFNDGAKAGTR